MSFNNILSLVLSKKPLNFDNFEELCNKGAHPLTKNKDGYNIFQLAQKDWTETDYLRILSICENNNKMRNSDFTKAYSSFCVNTYALHFNVIQKFFDLGVDPNTIFIRGNSPMTLLQRVCSEPAWNATQKLCIIKIIANTKKVTPRTFMKACKLYVESTSEILSAKDFPTVQRLVH